MAFQSGVFDPGAFDVLEEGYELLKDMSEADNQQLVDVVLRSQWHEVGDAEVISAVPDSSQAACAIKRPSRGGV